MTGKPEVIHLDVKPVSRKVCYKACHDGILDGQISGGLTNATTEGVIDFFKDPNSEIDPAANSRKQNACSHISGQ
jgi:hypothetical protein